MVINSCTSPASSGGPGVLPVHGMEQHVPGLTLSLEPASFPSSLYEGEATSSCSSSSPPRTSDRQLVDLDRQSMEASLCPRGLTDRLEDEVLSPNFRHLPQPHPLLQPQQQQQQQLALHQQDVDAATTPQQPEFCRVVSHLGHPGEQVLSGPGGGGDFVGMMPASVSLPGDVDYLGDGGPALASLPVSSPCSSSPSSMSSSSYSSCSAPSPLTHGSLYSPLGAQYRPPAYGPHSHPHLQPLHNAVLYPGYNPPLHTLPPPPPPSHPASPSSHLSPYCYDLYPGDAGPYDGQGLGQGACSFPCLSQPLGAPGFLGGGSGMGGSQTGIGGGGLLGGRGCGRGLDSVKKKERVRRPMNSFMVWSKNERKRLAKELPACNNSDLSRELGRIWKSMSQTEKQPFSERAMELAEEHKQKYPDYKYKPRRRPKESKKANRRNKKLLLQQQQQQEQQLQQGEGAEYPMTAFHEGYVDSLEEEASKDSMLSVEGLKDPSFGLCASGNRKVWASPSVESSFLLHTAIDDSDARAGEVEGANMEAKDEARTVDLAADVAATPCCVSSSGSQFTTSRSTVSSSVLPGSAGVVKSEDQASLEGVDPVASAPLLSDLLHTPPYSPEATKPNVLEFHHLRLQAGGHILSVGGRVTSPSLATTTRPGVDPSPLSPTKRRADPESSGLFERSTNAPRQPGKRQRPNAKTSRNSKSTANLISFPSGERHTSPFGGMPTPDGSPLERRTDTSFSACDPGHLRGNPARQSYGPHSQPASFPRWSGGSGSCADYGAGVGGQRREAQAWDSMSVPASLSSPLPNPLVSPCIKSLLQQPPPVLAARAHSQSCVTFGDRHSAVVSATSTVYSSYLPAFRRAHFGDRHGASDLLPYPPLYGGHTALPPYMPDSTGEAPAATLEQAFAGPSGWSAPSDCDQSVSLGGENCAFGGTKPAMSDPANDRLSSRDSGGSFDNSGPLHTQPQPHQQQPQPPQRASGQEEELSSLQQVFGLDKLDDFDSSELDCYLRVNQPDIVVPPSSSAHDLGRLCPTFQKRRWAMVDSRIRGDIYSNFSQQLGYSTNHPRGDDMHFPPSAVTRRLTYSPCNVDSKLAYVSHRNVGARLNCSPSSNYSDSEGSVVRTSYSSSSSPDSQPLQNNGESFYDLDKQMAVVNSYPRL